MKKLKEIFKEFGENTKPNEIHSCCGGGGHSHHHSGGYSSAKSYKCPMNCEGGKTYDTPGNCPVCNMTLVPVSESHRHH